MTDQFISSIAHIFSMEDDNYLEAVGMGFLVSDRHVITCAHVVANSLGLPKNFQEIPRSQIKLEFPLTAQRKTLNAHVVCWTPTYRGTSTPGGNGDDIAILELETVLEDYNADDFFEQEDLPYSAKPIQMVLEYDLSGQPFRILGLSGRQDKSLWISGILGDKQVNDWLEIKAAKGENYFAETDFSGTPVWDDEAEGVVGMVVSTMDLSGLNTAFMIPTSTLIKVWSELSAYVTDDLKNYLQSLANRLSWLPRYYPPHLDFDHIHQSVRVSQKYLRSREEATLSGEMACSGWYSKEESEHKESIQTYRAGNEPAIIEWDNIRNQLIHAVILGEPGFGKTWLLHYEGRRVAQEQLVELQQEKKKRDEIILPIYLHLDTLAIEIAQCGDVYDAIVGVLQRQYYLPNRFARWLRQQLPGSHCLLLLDALDAVSVEYTLTLETSLRWLAGNSQCRIIVTTRNLGYKNAHFKLGGDEQEQELELLAFSEEQVYSLVRSVLDSPEHSQLEEGFSRENTTDFTETWLTAMGSKQLLQILSQESVLRSISHIPILLSFLCFIGFKDGRIPTQRTKLFEMVLHHLLGEPWFPSDVYISSGDKLLFLEQIAWYSANSHKHWSDLITEFELIQAIEEFCKKSFKMQIGLLEYAPIELVELIEWDEVLVKVGETNQSLAKSQMHYLFSHHSLHEYLVARYLANQPIDKWLDLVRFFLYRDSSWEEVIVLLAGCLDDPNPLLKVLLAEPSSAPLTRPLLVGRCIVETDRARVEHEVMRRVIEGLTHLYPGQQWYQAVGILEQIGKPAISGLIVVLKNTDELWSVRWMVAWLAARLGEPNVVEFLLTAIREEDGTVSRRAAEALDVVGEPIMPTLLATLQGKEEVIGLEVARILGEIGKPAVAGLLAALQDEREHVRREAIRSLVQIGELAVPELITTLQATLQSKDESLSYMVLEILAQIGDLRSVPILLITLRSEDDNYGALHGTAAEALEQIGESAVPELVPALQDENEDVRRIVARVLGQIGSSYAVDALLAVLRDNNEIVRKVVAGALGSIKDPRAIEGLLTALKDGSKEVREASVRALGQIGGPEAIEGLLTALKDGSKEVREVAISALGQIGGPHARVVEGLLNILKDEKETWSLRWASANSLNEIGDLQVVEELLILLLDERRSREIRRYAAEMLRQFGDSQSVNALLVALQNRIEPWYIRKKVVELLGQIGNPLVMESLLIALHDGHHYVRRTVVEVLGRIKDPIAVEELLVALHDNDWFVRLLVARALGYIGDPRAIEELRIALCDENELVHSAAKDALVRIESGSNSNYDNNHLNVTFDDEFP